MNQFEKIKSQLDSAGITSEMLTARLKEHISTNNSACDYQAQSIQNQLGKFNIPTIDNPVNHTNIIFRDQLTEARENNIKLNNELQDFKQQIADLKEKPKKWYQKIGIKIRVIFGTLISMIVGGIISQFIVTNWDNIVKFFTG